MIYILYICQNNFFLILQDILIRILQWVFFFYCEFQILHTIHAQTLGPPTLEYKIALEDMRYFIFTLHVLLEM
jgi:hypothetical protein